MTWQEYPEAKYFQLRQVWFKNSERDDKSKENQAKRLCESLKVIKSQKTTT